MLIRGSSGPTPPLTGGVGNRLATAALLAVLALCIPLANVLAILSGAASTHLVVVSQKDAAEELLQEFLREVSRTNSPVPVESFISPSDEKGLMFVGYSLSDSLDGAAEEAGGVTDRACSRLQSCAAIESQSALPAGWWNYGSAIGSIVLKSLWALVGTVALILVWRGDRGPPTIDGRTLRATLFCGAVGAALLLAGQGFRGGALSGMTPLFLAAALASPLIEELTFRRLWIGKLVQAGRSFTLRTLTGSAVFALTHHVVILLQPEDVVAYGPRIASLFAFSLLQSMLWLKTRSLLLCWCSHATANLLVLLYPGTWINGF